MLSAWLPTQRHGSSAKGPFHPLWHEPELEPLELTDRFTRKTLPLLFELLFWTEPIFVLWKWLNTSDHVTVIWGVLKCVSVTPQANRTWLLVMKWRYFLWSDFWTCILKIDVLVKLLLLLCMVWIDVLFCRTHFEQIHTPNNWLLMRV